MSTTITQFPISLLPSFSKILEKLVHSRLSCFLEKHNFFSKFQIGFRENHSTELAVSCLMSKIANAMKKLVSKLHGKSTTIY